jgi:hypothetical protein
MKKKKSGEIINKFDLDSGASFVLDCEAGFGYHATDTPYFRIFRLVAGYER